MRFHDTETLLKPSGRPLELVIGLVVLRIAGVLMILGSCAWPITDPRNPWTWFHAVSLSAAGVACWVLADRRQPRDAMDEKTSQPANQPID